VPVNDQSRQFCFGSAAVKGKRVCDRHVPDYTTLHDTCVPRGLRCARLRLHDIIVPWFAMRALHVCYVLMRFVDLQKNGIRRVRAVRQEVCLHSVLPQVKVHAKFRRRCGAQKRVGHSHLTGTSPFLVFFMLGGGGEKRARGRAIFFVCVDIWLPWSRDCIGHVCCCLAEGWSGIEEWRTVNLTHTHGIAGVMEPH
jgi:hypothetical protein